MQQYHSLDIIISIWLVLCSSIQPLIGVRINPRQRSVRHFPNFLERHLDPKEPSELGRSWAPVFISPRSPLLRLYAHSKSIKITWKLKKPFLGSIEKAPSGKHPIQRYMGWPYIKESRNWGLSQDSESSFREQPETVQNENVSFRRKELHSMMTKPISSAWFIPCTVFGSSISIF